MLIDFVTLFFGNTIEFFLMLNLFLQALFRRQMSEIYRKLQSFKLKNIIKKLFADQKPVFSPECGFCSIKFIRYWKFLSDFENQTPVLLFHHLNT